MFEQRDSIKEFVRGCKACIPTLLAYWSIGFASGAVANISGLSHMQVAFASLFLYAGAGQFVLSSMLQSHLTLFAIWSSIFLLNIRYVLMSTYLSQYFQGISIPKKILLGSQLTDETFGVASIEAKEKKHITFFWMFGLNIVAYLNWFIANIFGSVFASYIRSSYINILSYSLIYVYRFSCDNN
ncbi:branched-chain amino acid ABC transporter permease [Neisseriaceae bacterium PsAf]|nr:branched-chain amino acid ABC transporter permease [Neisseriaceae bacterium PsAf]MCV2502785.1 AzlC family ABC transporter permease [Neisseriaceae bacterium]